MENIRKLIREKLDKYESNNKLEILKKGVSIVCGDLDIDIPEIEYINDPNYTKENKSFAAYSPSEKKVYVVIYNRNTADIMRSIAHELMHYKQDLDGRLTANAGEDGDLFENEANSYSGIIMRRLGREIDGIFESVSKLSLTEDFDTNEELKTLANDIFKVMIKRAVTNIVYNNTTNWIFTNVFQNLSPKYNKLNKFLKEYFLKVEWSNISDKNGGAYFLTRNSTNGTIVLKNGFNDFTNGVITNTFKLKRDKENSEIKTDELKNTFREVYFDVYSDKVISTLIHELQHCYDSWRSKNRYASDKKSKEYYSEPKELTDKKMFTKYLRLHHEINARFSQAIVNSKLIEINFDKKFPDKPLGYQYSVPINEFIKSFKLNFFGYNYLTEKQKKYVLRRASQYYHAAKDKYDGKIKG